MEFKIKKLNVTVGYSFLLTLCLFLLTDSGEGWAAVMLFSIAIHEMAHWLAMKAFGVEVESIRFSAFGIDLHRSPRTQTCYWRDIIIYACGPLVNFLVFYIGRYYFYGEFWFQTAVFNLVIGLFNCIPIVPLDGGQILSLLAQRFCSPRAAERGMQLLGGIALSVVTGAALFLYWCMKQGALLLFCTIIFWRLLQDAKSQRE